MTTRKVLQFPSPAKKDRISEAWNGIEKAIRDRASAAGYAEEKVDAVCKRLKKYHEELSMLTEFKMALPHPEGLSEEQHVAVQDLLHQMEIRCRDQMSVLLTAAFKAIAKLEWAWEEGVR